MRGYLLAGLIGLMLTAGMLVAPARAGDEMSVARAGKYYLKIACPGRAATVHFNRVVFHGNDGISVAEIMRRLPELRRESGRLGRAYNRFARQAFNPPAPWPSTVARQVDRFATLITRESALLGRMASAGTAAAWVGLIKRVNRLPYGSLQAQIQARLNLPAHLDQIC